MSIATIKTIFLQTKVIEKMYRMRCYLFSGRSVPPVCYLTIIAGIEYRYKNWIRRYNQFFHNKC